jgi:hypothetical protein
MDASSEKAATQLLGHRAMVASAAALGKSLVNTYLAITVESVAAVQQPENIWLFRLAAVIRAAFWP